MNCTVSALYYNTTIEIITWGAIENKNLPSQVALVVKNLPVNTGDVRDVGLIPELERYPGEENGNPF